MGRRILSPKQIAKAVTKNSKPKYRKALILPLILFLSTVVILGPVRVHAFGTPTLDGHATCSAIAPFQNTGTGNGCSVVLTTTSAPDLVVSYCFERSTAGGSCFLSSGDCSGPAGAFTSSVQRVTGLKVTDSNGFSAWLEEDVFTANIILSSSQCNYSLSNYLDPAMGGMIFAIANSNLTLIGNVATKVCLTATSCTQTLNSATTPDLMFGFGLSTQGGTVNTSAGSFVTLDGFSMSIDVSPYQYRLADQSCSSCGASGTQGFTFANSGNIGIIGDIVGGYNPPPPPATLTCSFTTQPASGFTTNTVITFLSTVGGGTVPYTYAWKFGDGSPNSTVANPTHTYASASSFNVNLTVYDNGSPKQICKAFKTLTINGAVGPPPVPPPPTTPLPIQTPTSGQQVFFDDFLSSGFPSQWTPGALNGQTNVTQTGGYLTITEIGGTNGVFKLSNGFTVQLIANGTAPVIQTGVSNQFLNMIFKLQAFNITNPVYQNFPILADLQFGVETSASGGVSTAPSHAVYFELVESNVALSTFWGNLQSKQAIYLASTDPFGSNGTNTERPNFFGLSAPVNDGLVYSDPSGPVDVNSMHIYSMEISLAENNTGAEWVRFQVDNNRFTTLWQNQCLCMGTGAVSNLWPFITLTYFVKGASAPFAVSQSLGSAVDYVAGYSFIPPATPLGQPLTTPNPGNGIPAPYGTPFPGVQGGTLTAFIVGEAHSLDPGNLYSGGIFLEIIIALVFTIVIGGAVFKFRGITRPLGMIWTIGLLGLTGFLFYCGVIPVWIPAIQVLLSAAFMYGIIRTGGYDGGGMVPD